jgi:hypothetical protein
MFVPSENPAAVPEAGTAHPNDEDVPPPAAPPATTLPPWLRLVSHGVLFAVLPGWTVHVPPCEAVTDPETGCVVAVASAVPASHC